MRGSLGMAQYVRTVFARAKTVSSETPKIRKKFGAAAGGKSSLSEKNFWLA